jgi:hypothetical protein
LIFCCFCRGSIETCAEAHRVLLFCPCNPQGIMARSGSACDYKQLG